MLLVNRPLSLFILTDKQNYIEKSMEFENGFESDFSSHNIFMITKVNSGKAKRDGENDVLKDTFFYVIICTGKKGKRAYFARVRFRLMKESLPMHVP